MTPPITILTDPVPCGKWAVSELTKSLLRPVRHFIYPLPKWLKNQKYRGHFAVTRSLVEGLQKIGASFNYNPRKLKDVNEIVVVLSGIGTLRQAIELKRRGLIRRLLVGPNILVLPTEHPEIGAAEVDLCITPCEWTRNAYEKDLPILKGRCRAWPAGVDVNFWKPLYPSNERKGVTIFIKTPSEDENIFLRYTAILKRAGYDERNFYLILRDNRHFYTPEKYYDALSNSQLLVGFSKSESQGIAWAEAWAMDVPTFLLRNEIILIHGKKTPVSSAPYLTSECGSFFDDSIGFEQALKRWKSSKFLFHPRNWVLRNMSDEVSAKTLISLLNTTN